MPKPHPWRELRRLTHIVLQHVDLPGTMWGATNGHTIFLDRRLLQVERRCTLAHELEHIRRGHSGCQTSAVERAVEAAAARWLLPNPRDVADALVWAQMDLHLAADHLWVDVETLTARLDPMHLHPAERAIIAAHVAEHQVPA